MARDDETLASFFGDSVVGPPPTQPLPVTPPPTEPVPVVDEEPDEQFAPVDEPPVPSLTVHDAALVAEACSKSGLVWVRPAGSARFHAAWHVWHEGAVTVVFGVDEQMLPILDGEVEVTVPSKDSGARLVSFHAYGDVLVPGTPEWDAAATALAAVRLNAREPAEQRARWERGSLVVRLTPLYLLAAGAGTDDEPSTAAQPPGNAGTTTGRQPWHLGGRAGRRRRQRT